LNEVKSLQSGVEELQTKSEEHYKELHNHFDGVKSDNAEIKAKVDEKTKEFAEITAELQETKSALDMVKSQIEAPIYRNEKDLGDADRESAVELQRRSFMQKNGTDEGFKPDMENLVSIKDMRSVARKIVKTAGLESMEKIKRSFTAEETKAFDAANMDAAFFMPEILGFTPDCNPESAYLLDLYGTVNVSRSSFKYPHIQSYEDLGYYSCGSECDADVGEGGNVTVKNGQTHHFVGAFCFRKEDLAESSFDYLSFMVQSMQQGWLTADLFPKFTTQGAQTFDHVDYRKFLFSGLREYGAHMPIMHQNVLAWLMSKVDNNGRFIFGDGDLCITPETMVDCARISNTLPDPTTDDNGVQLADEAWTSGDFIMAMANWENAYKAVEKQPMIMEQFMGGTTLWCVKYHFDAQDGGVTHCGEAGRVLTVA
jgi:hypothetical protein